MSWFIFSEVMFFGAFFGALFYAREIALHQLGSLDYKLIWPDFTAVWPNNGPAELVGTYKSMQPWPVPTINTALLLSSGATLTVSHHALRDNHRKKAMAWLAATLVLGVSFLFLQGFEYFHGIRKGTRRTGACFFYSSSSHLSIIRSWPKRRCAALPANSNPARSQSRRGSASALAVVSVSFV